MMKNLNIILVCVCTWACALLTACSSGNDTKTGNNLVISPDISNQDVRAFAEDSTGHVWIGTFRGLNKFDGNEYHQYFCDNDSTGLPDNHINDLMHDSNGQLWVGTVNGVCKYTAQDTFRRVGIKSKNRNCLKLLETHDHRILAYNLMQVLEYDAKTDSFVVKLSGIDTNCMYVGNCYVSRDNRLWIASPTCLRSYDVDNYKLRDSIPLKNFPMRFSIQGDDTLWLSGNGALLRFSMTRRQFLPTTQGIEKLTGTNADYINNVHAYNSHTLLVNMEADGLILYDTQNETLIDQDNDQFPFDAPSSNVNRMFTDSQGNIWLGTSDKGVKIIRQKHGQFYDMEYINRTIGQQSVPALATDGKQYLWMGTQTRGLYVYNMKSHNITHIEIPTMQKERHCSVKCLMVASDGRLWIGTKDAVLRCRYDGATLTLEKRWSVFMPMCMANDSDGTVWVSTSSSYVLAFRNGADEPQPLQAYPNGFVFIPCVTPLNDGSIMLAAFNQKMLRVDRNTLETSMLPVNEDDMKKCVRRSVFIPTAVRQDHCGEVWIGTVCNGVMVYNPTTQQMRRVEGVSCSDITAIEEDMEGNVWISTMNGLNCYERSTGKVAPYYLRNGIACNQFYDRSSCRLHDGTIVFGGTHGLTAFNSSEKVVRRSVPLRLEYLTIHNNVVRPSAHGAISNTLGLSGHITIEHNQNSFGIKYSALDYGDPHPTHYMYRLDGFDNDWRDVGAEHTAYYANVPAGKYVFRVKSKEGGSEASIDVRVKPAPYKSWWAYIIYTLLGIGAAGHIIRIRRRIMAQALATRKAEQEREQEQRVNKMNMSYFANISHEFRTPLTMISGPIEMLAADSSLSASSQHLVATVRRSVARMLRLVNQLMDFNKLENDTLRLKVTKADAVKLLDDLCEPFAYNMQSKNLTMVKRGIDDSMTVWVDTDKFEKIINNLLSNAVKFTPRGGKISIVLDIVTIDGKQCMKVIVADNGPGIPPEHLEDIFRKYYQVDNPLQEKYNWGTGIGLYYARRLAELHHGHLAASNAAEGHGAVFTLTLPIEENAYRQTEKGEANIEQRLAYPLPCTQHDDACIDSTRPTILVVDDDPEITDYLHTLLSPHYNVITRFDADSALQTIADNQPQVVLSDIVMPRTNGYQLCQKIKNDIQLCHIPVILVTAKSTAENQVEGLSVGADAYVTKPFDPHVLLAQIRSLLDNRQRTRKVLTHATAADDSVKEVLSQQDKKFMEELYKLMEDELANSELDILHITDMMHISRTKFYYKIKGLTGETPATFFRTYKLNRAAQMLQTGQYNISEVSDLTGFSTQSHFSNLFKKQFGMTPSEYKGTNK